MTSTERQDPFDFAPAYGTACRQMQQFQHQQWLNLLVWQQSLLVMQRDLYDQWLSRCAGAARLDD